MSDANGATVLLLASREYINNRAVLAHVADIPLTSTVLVTSYRIGVGHVVCAMAKLPNVALIKWQPTRPTQDVKADRAIVFWDGTPDILRSIRLIRQYRVPVEIIDPDGNTLDLPAFCARLGHNGGKVATSTTTVKPTAPTVIVDAPLIAPGESAKRDSKVRLQFHVPESTVEQYELQARAAGVSIEKLCSDRLRTCVTYTSGRGLYFNDAERSTLERVTGGHLISDAPMALQRIQTTVTLKVGDITVELTGRVLARCSSRAKSVRKSLEDYVRQEVIQGLERSVGLRPY